LLILLAEVKLSGRKQPLDDHVVPLDPVELWGKLGDGMKKAA
jgi:hypothetical protein